jgi:diguanylate cyclase (GGDEF)-like protein
MMTTIAVQVSAWFTSNRFNQKQLSQHTNNAKAVLEQYMQSQETLLVTSAGVLTADFGFIKAVATSDMQTINSVLHNHARRIDADLMLFTDRTGKVEASSTDTELLGKLLNPSAVERLIKNPAKSLFTTIADSVYQLILLPVRAPHVIGYSIVGFEIDQNSIEELKSLTGLEISIYQDDRHLLSSTFRMESFKAFEQALNTQSSPWFFIDRPAFLTERVELNSADSHPVCVLLVSSLKPLYQQYDETVKNNTLLALIIGLIASLLSIIFARSLTIPLSRLASLANEYAKGDYLKNIEINGGQEIDDLKQSFRNMGWQVKKREDEIRYQATHDILTGLINLQTLQYFITEQLRKDDFYIVVAFNIQNFKLINDRLGSEIADSCLIALAERLNKIIAVDIKVSARMDGVKFVSIIKPKAGVSPMDSVDAFLAELENDFRVADLRLKLDINAGITLYPDHGVNAQTLLRRTSIALQAARNDKQRIHCYEDGEDEVHLQRIAMMEALRDVIIDGGRDELFMVYQPKVSMHDREYIKTEALIRWQRSDNSFVSPEIFVNLAEEASLIVDLTHWVVDTVMQQLRRWHDEGVLIGAAVNVSAQDLANPGFEDFIKMTCDKYGVAPKFITIEITERDIMHDEASVVMSLRNLRKMGFMIAIDDYGIGQSSLSKLKGLPVDEIKLDKSFIMNLDQSPKDQLIVKSTIELAHGLGFEVIAEGVENKASLNILKDYDCDQIQGYYLSKPIAADAVSEWIQDYVENNSNNNNGVSYKQRG